jgi:hypothetical protein
MEQTPICNQWIKEVEHLRAKIDATRQDHEIAQQKAQEYASNVQEVRDKLR